MSPVADQLRLSIGTFQPAAAAATSHSRAGATSNKAESRAGATSNINKAESRAGATSPRSMVGNDKYHTKVWSSGPRQWLR